jgi:hypothetical protein
MKKNDQLKLEKMEGISRSQSTPPGGNERYGSRKPSEVLYDRQKSMIASLHKVQKQWEKQRKEILEQWTMARVLWEDEKSFLIDERDAIMVEYKNIAVEKAKLQKRLSKLLEDLSNQTKVLSPSLSSITSNEKQKTPASLNTSTSNDDDDIISNENRIKLIRPLARIQPSPDNHSDETDVKDEVQDVNMNRQKKISAKLEQLKKRMKIQKKWNETNENSSQVGGELTQEESKQNILVTGSSANVILTTTSNSSERTISI